ncbi:unnamed protein product [Trypanosoma congolense IL3000]|uniref:WGS project CAEQ00000000 data, annotated contig 344 n=1 Tax=Trypanosoma congolense (strain IL3000) TaxID=1068625 RepID=F9WF37_TRYCI|nr:unnamed protein product [Trypanosoma congolense IL3000]
MEARLPVTLPLRDPCFYNPPFFNDTFKPKQYTKEKTGKIESLLSSAFIWTAMGNEQNNVKQNKWHPTAMSRFALPSTNIFISKQITSTPTPNTPHTPPCFLSTPVTLLEGNCFQRKNKLFSSFVFERQRNTNAIFPVQKSMRRNSFSILLFSLQLQRVRKKLQLPSKRPYPPNGLLQVGTVAYTLRGFCDNRHQSFLKLPRALFMKR